MTNAQEFEAFMIKYQDMVYSTAMRLTANNSEAQDISQEVFIKAYERFDELSKSPTVAGWLRKVATNMSLNHLSRYRSRWSFFSEMFSQDEETSAPEPEFAAADSVSEAIEIQDRSACVEQALQKLPASQRVPLVLFHMEGLQYDEIAKALRVSVGKVKTDIFRGREALRVRLKSMEAFNAQ